MELNNWEDMATSLCKVHCKLGCRRVNDCPSHQYLLEALDAVEKMDIATILAGNVSRLVSDESTQSITAVWGAMRAIGLGADAKKTVERLMNGSFNDYNLLTDSGLTEEELKRYGFTPEV